MNARDVEYSLSCYLSPPGNLSVLAPRHDQGVALWRRSGARVELVRLWEVERVSGQKHHAWPLFTPDRTRAFLDGLLATEGLRLADIRRAWGTPGVPGAAEVAIPAGAGEFPVHSLSHLFSGLLIDTEIFKNETIVGLAVDGAPDTVLDTRSPGFWYAGCLSRRGELAFAPVDSPGPLYTAASTLFGLEPGTLMALATACRTAIAFDIEAAVASLRLPGGRTTPWAAAFGLVQSLISEAGEQLAGHEMDSGFTREENIRSAVMKHVQRACDLISIRNVERICALGQVRTQDAYLSTSGGFALNCPSNTLLLDLFGFRGLLTPPCANDSGQALGLGLLGLYGIGAFDDADFRLESAYYGAPIRDAAEAVADFAPWVEDVKPFDPGQFVVDITGNVLAWVDGPAEIGPRALGHRSLLGDPRSTKVKDLLNECKQRQWWRPVAPIVLAGHAGGWFDHDRPSPYMLEAVQVRPEASDQVPAIVHLDGTARHQTVSAQVNPLLYRAIDAFREETGIPILCNTSLNDKGEPIVNTAAEAFTFCINKGIKLLYLEEKRIALRDEPEPARTPPTGPRVRAVSYFTGQESQRDAFWEYWRKIGYSDAGIFLLTWSPSIRLNGSSPALVNKLAEYYASSDDNFAGLVASFHRDGGPGSYFIEPGAERPRPVIVE